MRTCIGCRATDAQSSLLRLVVGEDGEVALGRTLPGRGAWLHPRLDCVRQAQRRRSLTRALRVSGEPLRIDWDRVAAQVTGG